jgi:EmrB/QacA subfamily drug resistance transporter
MTLNAFSSPALDRRAKRLILAATVTGSSMAFIDGSVVNVATPAIQSALGFGAGGIQWVINGYLLFLGALVLIGGAAADRFGRRRVFLIGVIAFTLASLACGLAAAPAMLVVARCVQGAAAALLTPASLAILGASFGDDERGRAIGAWAGFGALTSAIGPALGGWLVDALSWRSIFLLNLPLAAAAIAMTLKAMPETQETTPRRIDYAGAFLVAIGLGLLIWGLSRAGEVGVTAPQAWGCGLAGLAALAGFVRVEARSDHPMAPLALFRSRAFAGANLLTLGLYFAVGGALFFLPFELIRVHGYSAAGAGAALLPLSLIMGLFSGLAGRLADRMGARLPLILGPLISAAGYGLLAASGVRADYWRGFLPGSLVLAIGMTVSVAPLTATVMGAVVRDKAGTASGINIAIARIAGLLAIAIMSLIFIGRFDSALGDLAGRAGLPASALPPPGGALAVNPTQSAAGLALLERAALHAAYVDVMICAAAAAALGAVASAVLIVGPKAGST